VFALLVSVVPAGASNAPVQGAASAVPAAVGASLVPVASGLDRPVFVTNAHDGSDRLFVVEQPGRVRVIDSGGTLLPTPLLDIRSSVASSDEQGLLGLAFHPKFATNRKFYVYFTNVRGDIAVNQYRVSASDPNVVESGSGVRIITIDHPAATNHNGGMLAFGKDGYLYIGTGDGGSAGDPGNRAQSKDVLLGKILRIDVDHGGGSRHYSSPTTNPFVGRAGRNEIWSYGLRNPWRFSFDRVTGDIWIGDVGQNRYEEIDRGKRTTTATRNGRGANYGWRVMEGNHCYRPSSGCNRSGKVRPISEYSHASGRCSVVGGYVYRGTMSPGLAGRYVFGDFCAGQIRSLSRTATTGSLSNVVLSTGLMITSFGEDEGGEIYVTDLGGSVNRISAS
jgi:glucose/arabinose dehydrogenase